MLAKRYTLGEQGAFATELPLCVAPGACIVIAGVFSSGLCATIEAAKFNYADATLDQRKIEAVCKRYGVPHAAAALQVPLHCPAAAPIIPGGFRPEHVTVNLDLFRREIPLALGGELKQSGLLDTPRP